jgi:hypothetical protein
LSLNEAGFLSPDIQLWIEKHRRESPDAFRIAEAVNRAGVTTLYASKPLKSDNLQLMVTLLFGRILSHYQSTLVLLERGAVDSAKAVMRVMLEATFIMGACIKDATYLDLYVKDDRKRQAELIQALLSLPAEDITLPAEELEQLREQANALQSDIKADGLPKIGAFYAAQRAELLDFYRLFYVPYCNTVHTSVRDLASHVNEGPEGEIASLKWGPESAAVDDLVDAAIQIFFAAAHLTLNIFPQADQNKEFERLWEEQKPRLERKAVRQ